ncbi:MULTISPECIES: hypothetical protein [unclassified Streptomyces]|uniref:hypothetical protein n=1 Tax=unclassified Streptomyces TaxID=2593676 RepID=UPI00109C7A23|nr:MULTISPECIES: hypothetical protein [unclassified Streptomyces]MCE3034176.1 hypothetical protein [Streptomyces sp. CMSTAAHL-2]TGZ17067.1 hypothetical protein DV517_20400 [Streptomyces sp. S816]
MRTRTKLVLTAVGIASAGATFVGVATAADSTDTVTAPYAQAAAQVDRDGALAQHTNTVESVTKAGTGLYCVKLASSIDAARSIPEATLSDRANWGSEIYARLNAGTCPENSVRVTTGTDGTAKDQPFFLVIP